MIKANKREERISSVEQFTQPQRLLKREKKLNAKNLTKFAQKFVAQNKGSIQDIKAKTPWREQWSVLVPESCSSKRKSSSDQENLFQEERAQINEKQQISTQEGSKNWGHCYDDTSIKTKQDSQRVEKLRGRRGDLPFHSLQNQRTTGFGFEVIGKDNDIRKEFAQNSYRNPYIDSDEWLDILRKKKPYPWIIPPQQLDTWHLRKDPYKPLKNVIFAYSDNFDHIQAELSGKTHGKVAVAQQNQQGEKQVLSAMVISFQDKARTQGSRLELIQHAKCIERLSYARMFWSNQDIKNMHRLSMENILAQEDPFLSAHIVTPRYLAEKSEKKSVLNPHDYFKARHKLTAKEGRIVLFEHIDQHPLLLCYFGMASRITRYVYNSPIPKHPQEMVKRNKLLKEEYDKLKHIGPFGPQIVMSSIAEHHKIPLIGKVDSQAYKGIAILENNMYRAPLFWHPIKSTDFILIKHKEQNGENNFYLRKASGLFTVGQEEPKVEAFNPATRNATAFFKKRTQACCLKMLEDVKRVPFSLFSKMFPEYTEQILKKFMKEVKSKRVLQQLVEFDRSQVCSLPIDQLTQRDYNILVTPQELCQFESCLRGQRHLHSLGIERIMSSDRVPSAVAKFASEEKDALTQSIARMIEREVLCTPWNISNNFLAHKDRGMMRLSEIGDPSNGRGGYSFLKQPLKVSQDQLISRATNIGQPDAAATNVAFASAFQNPKAVTGTDADLRKQSKDQIHKQLVAFGMKEEEVANLPRWEAVAFLREFSSQYTQRGEQGSFSKFARAIRLTGIKQRQLYWQRVSTLFKQQMDTLSAQDPNYSSEEEDTSSIIQAKPEQQQKEEERGPANKLASTLLDYFRESQEKKKEEPVRIEAVNQENQKYIQVNEEEGCAFPEGLGEGDYGSKVLHFKGNQLPEVTHLKDIPGIEKLGDVGQVVTESGATARQHTQLLQKVFRNEEGEIQKVLIISDERQIRSFLKRKKKSDQVMNRESQSKGMKRRAFQHLKDQRKKNAKPPPIPLSLLQGDADLIKAARGLSSGNRSEHHTAIALGLSGFDPSTITEDDLGQISTAPKRPKQHDTTYGRGTHDDQSYGGGMRHRGPLSVSNLSEVRESSNKLQIRIGADGRYTTVESSHKSLKRSATKDSNDGQIYESKRESRISRKRQGGAESEFNEKLADVVDMCILFDKSRLFHQEVRTKDFPDYYDKVETPMALSTLRGKCKRCEYETLESFKKDLIQIVTNSITYNGENNIVTQMARDVVKYGFSLVEKDEPMLQAKSKAIAALKNRPAQP